MFFRARLAGENCRNPCDRHKITHSIKSNVLCRHIYWSTRYIWAGCILHVVSVKRIFFTKQRWRFLSESVTSGVICGKMCWLEMCGDVGVNPPFPHSFINPRLRYFPADWFKKLWEFFPCPNIANVKLLEGLVHPRPAHLSPRLAGVPGVAPWPRGALQAGVATDTLDTLSTGGSRVPWFTLQGEREREREGETKLL